MYRKILTLVCFVSLFTSLFAGNGKIVGKIVDAVTKEPLIGASVVVTGTSYGAATNINGEYLIINVSPGTYTVKASYVGYNETRVENVRVYADLTTQTDLTLSNRQLQTKDIIVVAEKPLINKNQTNATSIIKSEDLANLPVRDVAQIVATMTGVVRQNGNIYVRGSRSDAVANYVDGVMVNDPIYGGSSTNIINSAIEEIQFQAGGYTAEYGGANAGIISTTLRTGKDEYQFTLEGVTDNFVGKNSSRKMLGGYSYGSSQYIATISGPVIPSEKVLRFYLAADNNFDRSRARFWDGINMPNLYDPENSKVDTVSLIYPAGYILNDASESWHTQGNLTVDLKPLLFKLSGTYGVSKYHTGWSSTYGITDMLNSARAPYTESSTKTINLKTTYVISNESYVDLNLNFYEDYLATMDYDLKHNLFAYGDSVENAKFGYTLPGDGQNLSSYSLYTISFLKYGYQEAGYQKRRDRSYQGKIDLFYQLGKNNELKAGADYKYWTIRRYSFAYVFNYYSLWSNYPDAPETWHNSLDNYGYDVLGNPSDESGAYGAKHPVFAAAYIQDKLEFNDLVINAGLRFDYIASDGQRFKNPHNIKYLANGNIDQSELLNVDPLLQISPRLGFSFNLTDMAKFHAQYGKFVQQTRLRDIYQGLTQVSQNIKGGLAIQNPVGFGLRPERTSQFDLGFSQQLGENLAIDITAFYKDIKDQVQIRTVYAEQGAAHNGYYAFVNGDFSTSQGVEFRFDFRRVERIAGSFSYTYSDARGTGSSATSGFYAIWQSPTATPYFPQDVSPLDFNQTHRGSLNFDYRFIGDDGPALLQNSGLDLLFTFNSGHNFTLVSGYANAKVPLEPLNSSTTPWNFQIDLRIDKTIKIGQFNTNIYVSVINLLNTKNIVDVFAQTGSTSDGILQTLEGQTTYQNYLNKYGEKFAKNYVDLYNAVNNNNANLYGPPRQIRVGVKLEY